MTGRSLLRQLTPVRRSPFLALDCCRGSHGGRLIAPDAGRFRPGRRCSPAASSRSCCERHRSTCATTPQRRRASRSAPSCYPSRLNRLVIDLETGVRGRLLTATSGYLEPYRAAQSGDPRRPQAALRSACVDPRRQRRRASTADAAAVERLSQPATRRRWPSAPRPSSRTPRSWSSSRQGTARSWTRMRRAASTRFRVAPRSPTLRRAPRPTAPPDDAERARSSPRRRRRRDRSRCSPRWRAFTVRGASGARTSADAARACRPRRPRSLKSTLPGQHEPRDPHAAERRDRHDRPAARHRARRRAARVRRAPRAPRASSCWRSSTTSWTSRRSRPATSSSSERDFDLRERRRGDAATLRRRHGARQGPRAVGAASTTTCPRSSRGDRGRVRPGAH